MRIFIKIGCLLFGLLACVLINTSCTQNSNKYLYATLTEHKKEQKELIHLLEIEKNYEIRFSLLDKIAYNLRVNHNYKALIAFLSSEINKSPRNNYNVYWLLLLGYTYLNNEMPEIATYYFERAIKDYPDMTIKGKSIHLMCLENLITISKKPDRQVAYYSRLINNFSENIDLDYAYFMLAQAYEKLGEWNTAIETYSHFINLRKFDIIIPGIPDSYGYARKIVDYNASSKNWTVESLDELVTTIKTAIRKHDYVTLERYRSKVNFFAISWKQELSETHQKDDFDLQNFMRGSHIVIAPTLDASSTPYEAFLRTSGWNQYIRTWYFYFRKVNFPADPNIHGRWEWAGIYYGEKI